MFEEINDVSAFSPPLSLPCVPSLPPSFLPHHPSFVLPVIPSVSSPPSLSLLILPSTAGSRSCDLTERLNQSLDCERITHTHTLKQLKAQLCTRPCSPEGPRSLECVSVWVCWWVCGCPASLFMGHWEMCVSQRRWTGYRGPRSPGLPLILLLLLPLSFLSSTPPLAQGAIHIPDNCEYSSTSTSTSTCSPLSTSSELISIQTQTSQRCSCHTHTSFNHYFYISFIFKYFNYMEISHFIWSLEFKVSKSHMKFFYNVESMWINERFIEINAHLWTSWVLPSILHKINALHCLWEMSL